MATMQYDEDRAILINDSYATPVKPGFRTQLAMRLAEHRPNNIPTGHIKIDVEIQERHAGNNWDKSQRFQFLLTRSQARELAEFLREQV